MNFFNALIRTHHITSRKKIAALKKAADTYKCYILLRTGGCPGVMYVEARREEDVSAWVNTVQRLRYKDYQLVARPAELEIEDSQEGEGEGKGKGREELSVDAGVREVESLKEFGTIMKRRGVWEWWRKGMGYAPR
jgi:hypothetical protein